VQPHREGQQPGQRQRERQQDYQGGVFRFVHFGAPVFSSTYVCHALRLQRAWK